MIKKFIFSTFLLLAVSFSYAEEGMLIPSLIEAFESEMKAKGMKLSAKDIYDVNNASLKDAIMHFNGGCTAELVSNKGLLLTNHHCGYSQIQFHSSLEKDYLKNGFWAKNQKEELPNSSLYASRMVRIDDVTKAILFGVSDDMTDADKAMKMRANVKTLIEDAERGTHYKAEIKPFNYGNDYYMIVKEVFTDVRLVGTPPNAIGKFGGDTDNWVWPRHTGDFSVFRIYAGADNKPADYSADNKPYKPLHYLPISMKDRKQGDFTMIYGFPGTTEQHLVSSQIAYYIEKERPARIGMREKSLAVIDATMRSSDEVRIQYSAKQARIANAYKKWIGQVDGLKSLGAIDIKLQQESEYVKRANSKKEWQKYAGLVADMNKLMESGKEKDFAYAMYIEYMFVGPEIFKLARAFDDLIYNFEGISDGGELEEKKEALRNTITSYFKDYNTAVDAKIFRNLTKEFIGQISPDYAPSILKNQKDLADYCEDVFEESFLATQEKALKAVDGLKNKRKAKQLAKDMSMMLHSEMNGILRSTVVPEYRKFKGEMDELLKQYVAGKKEMFTEKNMWADANGTLRITYGLLEGSAPTDGMAYTEHTTTDGILAKFRTGKADFELLPDMVKLYESKKFGRYAQGDELWVCFTGSNHTTGGNSGSPVIDGEGRLMGLNFDRSWESTMSDFMFDPSRCRNIVVDIRYVLWVMDVYGNAGHLVDEMTLQN
jgi:hypothetical protein